MNYVNDPHMVGGMINSIGLSEQDCASMKFMFDYLDNGLEEISFESADDFCLVLDNGEKIYIQVKINQLTVKFVKNLLTDYVPKGRTIIVGSSYDDDFRNLLQYRNRYFEAAESKINSDKVNLYSDFVECCQSKKIEVDVFLKCEYTCVDSINRVDIAKQAINSWAERRKLFVDVEPLFYEIGSVISNRLRTIGGHLSKENILEIIGKHRGSKIESFAPKKDRVSSVIEYTCKCAIIREIEGLATRYALIGDKLLLIKYSFENDQVVEARNRIEEILLMCPELKGIFLMTLNICKEYDAVIEWEKKGEKFSTDCIVEFAKAHAEKGEFTESQDCLESVDKCDWDAVIYYLSAKNYAELDDIDNSIDELEKCIKKDERFVDAYVFFASLIYREKIDLAVEYIDKALALDSKFPNAYKLMAQISKLSDDFQCVIDNYEKYIEYSGDYENDSVLLDLAINKFHAQTNDWRLAFCKWNNVHIKNRKISGEEIVPIIDLGIHYSCTFILRSDETGLTVLCNGEEIFAYHIGKTLSRSAIGLYKPMIDSEMRRFVMQNCRNPIQRSGHSIFSETALPTIFRFYNDIESYEGTVTALLKQNVLHLNHQFDEHINEYMIEAEDIDVIMTVNRGELTGDIIIGQVDLLIQIKLVSNKFDDFVNQINKDCSYNEAAIILIYGHRHQTQLRFPKKKMVIKRFDA